MRKVHFKTLQLNKVSTKIPVTDKNMQFNTDYGNFPTGLTFYKRFQEGTNELVSPWSLGANKATFTASRGASNPATYIDASGVVQINTTSDTPRWTQGYYATNGAFTAGAGLLLEGASTNLLKYSIFSVDTNTDGVADNWNAFDTTEGATFTTPTITDLCGITDCKSQRVQYTGVAADGNDDINLRADTTANGSIVQDDVVTASIWVKGNQSGLNNAGLLIQIRNAADNSTLEIFATAGTGWRDTMSSTAWERYELTFTITHADAARARFLIVHTNVDDGDTLDIQYALPQLEIAAFPSSHIPTTTAALTRNHEALSYPVANNFVGGTDGTIVLVYRPIMLPDEQSGFLRLFVVGIDGSNDWTIYHNTPGNDQVYIEAESGGVAKDAFSQAEPFGSIRYSLHSLIATYSTTALGGDKLIMYIDGSDDGISNANYTIPVGALPASFQIQSSGGQAMILTAVALFDKRLTTAEALQVHNLLT